VKLWQKKAFQVLDGIKLTPDFLLSQLTTFKVGGPLDLLVEPIEVNQLARVLDFCKTENLPWFILGLGSNLLVRDKGIRGVGIKLQGSFTEWSVNEQLVTSGAAVVLGDLSKATACLGLSGLEFACGIPGSVGGAVFMNAGAYDGEMSNVLMQVAAYDLENGLCWYEQEELELGYRQSRFQSSNQIIIKAEMELHQAEVSLAEAKITELTCQRQSKQPLEMPSAGSVFRRPEGYFVGPLIEQAGLKGFRLGGAQVSEKHAGFIVNAGGASAQDVLDLIAYIQKTIFEKNGVKLVPEIRVVGEE